MQTVVSVVRDITPHRVHISSRLATRLVALSWAVLSVPLCSAYKHRKMPTNW